ncbi:MAG: hypothetical protein HW401_877, partial [Parcubacteria group bacterium]|nr:hypothetical protein [Parcubacteria group bacterium]
SIENIIIPTHEKAVQSHTDDEPLLRGVQGGPHPSYSMSGSSRQRQANHTIDNPMHKREKVTQWTAFPITFSTIFFITKPSKKV